MAGINFTDEREYSKPLTFKNNDVINSVVVPKGTLCRNCESEQLVCNCNSGYWEAYMNCKIHSK